MSRARDQSGNTAKRAIEELFKKGTNKITSGDVDKLRSKYGDDVADDIVEEFYQMKDDVRENAQKAAQYVRGKYPHKSLHVLLSASRKYKQKLQLDDFAFEEFRRIFEAELSGQSVAMSRLYEPHRRTNVMEKALGSGFRDNIEGVKVRDDEYGDLQEILKIHAAMKPVHADIVIQHLMYTGVGPQSGNSEANLIALGGHFDRSKDRPECHVHPVVAAMFLPKIPILEKHFLIANLAGIIKGRKNREVITNKPDYLLHKAIVNDPNDVVCDPNSAIRDLRFRCMLQHHLLNAVRSLRNGQYFDCHNREFINAIENCRLNNFDNPELLYGQDEATVLSKLLGSFSFRPTVISQRPMATYDPNPRSIIPKIYTKHFLTFKIRNPRVPNPDPNAARKLTEVLVNVSYRREEGHFIPYEESVIYTNQVLFVLVPRKLMTVDLNRMLGRTIDPINLLDLPRNLTGFERVNPFPMEVPSIMPIASGEALHLVSAVSTKVNNLGSSRTMKGFIIGNMAYVKLPSNEWACYDPRIVNKPGLLRSDPTLGLSGLAQARTHGAQGIANQKSIYSLRPMLRYSNDLATKHLSRYGTVFIYSNPNAQTNMGNLGNGQQLMFHNAVGHSL
jgi:hypothetical protein